MHLRMAYLLMLAMLVQLCTGQYADSSATEEDYWTLFPVDDADCDDAIYLMPPYQNYILMGTTVGKPLPHDRCSPEWPSMTYLLAPAEGNDVSVKACGPGPLQDLQVTLYTASCWDPKCVDSQVIRAVRDCQSTTSELHFEVDEDSYWLVVSAYGPNADVGSQFTLTINEHENDPLTPYCEDALQLYGPYSPTLSIYGAVTVGGPNVDMPCAGEFLDTQPAWYWIEPYEMSVVSISTCNLGSVVPTSIQVFTGECDELECTPYNSSSLCNNGMSVSFSTGATTSFYVVVYGRGAVSGSFQLTIFETPDWTPPATLLPPVPSVSSSVSSSASSSRWPSPSSSSYPSPSPSPSSSSYASPLSSSSPLSSPQSSASSLPTPSASLSSSSSSSSEWWDDEDPVISTSTVSDWTTWTTDFSTAEPYDDDADSSSCNAATPASYGVTAGFHNDGEIYNNLCGLYTYSGSHWFVFTPTTRQTVIIDVCDSNFDTVLAVVSDCKSLGCIASNDDSCLTASSVRLAVSAGEQYFIYVAGYGGSSGSFALSIAVA